MRALVTGASGFVGRHLVARLRARGVDVLATDVVERGECRRLDITDAGAVGEAVAGVETVFHTASIVQTKASGRERVFAVNVGGTEKLLRACRAAGVPRFVHVSSASVVYRGRDIEGGDETLPYGRGQAPYADSKIEAEQRVLEANRAGLATCAIRPHIVFGPGDTRFLPNLVARAEAGKLKVGVGSASKLSDFTYVENLIDALVAADESLAGDGRAAGQAYFVSNGEPLGFWRFVDKVLVALGHRKVRGYVPYPVAYGFAALAELWHGLRGGGVVEENGVSRFAVRYMCTHHYFDISKARRELGYEPAVSIDDGIARTVAALRVAA
jgi:sterol-4alpha-carboxylate 3-dehydrogenase (decarboxylating)